MIRVTATNAEQGKPTPIRPTNSNNYGSSPKQKHKPSVSPSRPQVPTPALQFRAPPAGALLAPGGQGRAGAVIPPRLQGALGCERGDHAVINGGLTETGRRGRKACFTIPAGRRDVSNSTAAAGTAGRLGRQGMLGAVLKKRRGQGKVGSGSRAFPPRQPSRW